MESTQDYLTRKELGIRIIDGKKCCVIRLRDDNWTEIGSRYSLPLDAELTEWTALGIPASTLAVALRVYELDHPGSELRSILTQSVKRDVQDYLTRKELGIRVTRCEFCQVIRYRDHEWIEIGEQYELPLESSILQWASEGIPASMLAVALRVYELDHPRSGLRRMLIDRPAGDPVRSLRKAAAVR